MSERKQILLELDQSDNHLLQRIADHCRLPMAYVLRIALRHYAMTGNWPIGCDGLREDILERAREINQPKRKAKGAK